MSFADLGLSEKVLRAVEAAGYSEPTPIQAGAIPVVLQRRDVLGIAQTGTGKTASFTLPMLTMLEKGRARARMPRSLILEPTRELAAQVAEAFEVYGAQHKLTVALLIGGVSFKEQDRKLDRGADVLIATPGRMLDHFERGKLMLNGVETLVIDEADRMLDMGFIPDIERIFKLTPMTRQTLFFSATMPAEIQRLTNVFLHNPEIIKVASQTKAAETITQRFKKVPADAKERRSVLRQLLKDENVGSAIIFCNRKRDVRIVYKSLAKHGFNAGELHGDMDQRSRNETLDGFRNGKIALLVASDVAARGLDIPDVGHVFNFDVPIHAEDYVHRIGRTGRAGRSGAAITLVAPEGRKALAAIEDLLGTKSQWIGEEPGQASRPPSGSGEKDTREADGETKRRRPNRNRNRGRQNSEQSVSSNPPTTSETPDDAAKKPIKPPVQKASSEQSTSREAKPNRPARDNTPVKGMGDHVPAFLSKPPR